jgi:hypothetical protein
VDLHGRRAEGDVILYRLRGEARRGAQEQQSGKRETRRGQEAIPVTSDAEW